MKPAKVTRYAQLGSTALKARRRSVGMWTISAAGGVVQQLTAEIPEPSLPAMSQRIDLTPWARFEHLYRPFADALVSLAPSRSPRTRIELVKTLTLGWFDFLASTPLGATCSLGDITSTLINEFIVWLDQSLPGGGEKWSVGSRMQRLGMVRLFLVQIAKIPRWARELQSDLVVPHAPWTGSHLVARPTAVLTTAEWHALYQACKSEVAQTIKDVTEDWKLIERGRTKLPKCATSGTAYRDIEICLAEFERSFPGPIPISSKVFAKNPHLHNAVINYHTYTRVARPFQPRPRLLVPFVILLGMQTHANGSLLLRLRESQFSQREVMGQMRLLWQQFKPRANSTQRRSFLVTPDEDNPAELLRWLKSWTKRIRPFAPHHLRDRIFLFLPEWGPKGAVTTYMPANTDMGSMAWSSNLKRFLRDHRLPMLNLRMIRATGLDQVSLVFDGDLRAIQAAGNQKSAAVIAQSYASGAARARSAERVGHVVELRNRWVRSQGKIDPRRKKTGQDHGAATPGWICLDPFDSPIIGQTPGRLCGAYGACPICPLAQINFRSPYSMLRVLQLKALLTEAQTTIPSRRWHLYWAPVLRSLNDKWLPQFNDASLLCEAKTVHVSPLPALE